MESTLRTSVRVLRILRGKGDKIMNISVAATRFEKIASIIVTILQPSFAK